MITEATTNLKSPSKQSDEIELMQASQSHAWGAIDPGILLVEDFLTLEQENEILSSLDLEL